jgi:hypothetical protein
MSNSIILLVFLTGTVSLLLYHSHTEVEIILCKNNQNKMTYIGHSVDYAYLKKQGVISDTDVCQSKTMTQEVWWQTRNALNRSFVNTKD